MCTLTIFPLGNGNHRLAFNRDEARSRSAATPPRWRCYGDREALLPIDPAGRGTWIAVNDAGLAMALLNVNRQPLATGRPTRSRGTLIPALLGSGSLAAAVRRAADLGLAQYAPFRLVLFAGGEPAECLWDGHGAGWTRPAPLAAPVLFTSSGLGDDLVESPRRRLFEALLAGPGDAVARQDAFHRHSWPDGPHLSVCMRRPDACTVSHTVIRLSPSDVVMTYFAGAPDRPSAAVTDRLRIPQGGQR
jgi:hypothetical protein